MVSRVFEFFRTAAASVEDEEEEQFQTFAGHSPLTQHFIHNMQGVQGRQGGGEIDYGGGTFDPSTLPSIPGHGIFTPGQSIFRSGSRALVGSIPKINQPTIRGGGVFTPDNPRPGVMHGLSEQLIAIRN